jgi:hypothetical protein
MTLPLLRKLNEIIIEYAQLLYKEGSYAAHIANIEYPYDGPIFAFELGYQMSPVHESLIIIDNTERPLKSGTMVSVYHGRFIEPKSNQVRGAFDRFLYWERKIHWTYEHLSNPTATRREEIEIVQGKLLDLTIEMLRHLAESYAISATYEHEVYESWTFPGIKGIRTKHGPLDYFSDDLLNRTSSMFLGVQAAYGLRAINGQLRIDNSAPPSLQLKVEEFNDVLFELEDDLAFEIKIAVEERERTEREATTKGAERTGDARSEITERILELERTYAKESSEVDFSGIVPSDRLIRRWEAMGGEIDMLKGQLAVLDGTKALTPKDEESPATEPPSPKKPAPGVFEGLGKKQRDLSSKLDGYSLTERQRDCISLRLEYGLNQAEIGKRLGITGEGARKLLARADRRINNSLANDRKRRGVNKGVPSYDAAENDY